MFRPLSEFARASDEAKNALITALSRRAYGNNEVVYLQEEAAEHLYFVISGHVRLSYVMDDGSAILYAILPPGDSFGELGIFDGGVHCDMAMGMGNTVVGSISLKKFDGLRQSFPDLHQRIALMVASRYRSYIELTRLMSLLESIKGPEDLKRFDVPTLFLHGDDDQIVPIGAAAMLSSKIVKGAKLKVFKGAPHGMCTTLKDEVNADLLAFIKS
jgi:CRP-like cAMP-binding protein